MERGISPIVAVVLLIAIAVIAGTALYFWTAGLATKQPTPNTPSSITAVPLGGGKVLIANLGSSPISTALLDTTDQSLGLECPAEIPAGEQALCTFTGYPSSDSFVIYLPTGGGVQIETASVFTSSEECSLLPYCRECLENPQCVWVNSPGQCVKSTCAVECDGSSRCYNESWASEECGMPATVCGNSVIEGSEECDDGNAYAGDGCSSSCFIEDWALVYDSGIADDDFKHVIQDGSSLIVTGVKSASRYWVLSFSPTGTYEWDASFDKTGGYDRGWEIVKASDGNYVVTGEASGTSSPYKEWTIKVDGTAHTQTWENYYSAVSAKGFALIEDANQNIVVAGCKYDNTVSRLHKMTAGGVEVWNNLYNAAGDDAFWDLVDDGEGNYVMTGEVNGPAYDVQLVKVFANGTQAAGWGGNFNVAGGDDQGHSIVRVGTDYYVAGYATTGADTDGLIMKFNSVGVLQWNYTYGGANNDRFNALSQTADGGLVAAGHSYVAGMSLNMNGWLLKIDANGVEQWSEKFGWSENDAFYDVEGLSSGRIAAVGTTKHANYDGWIVMTDENGSLTA